MNALLAELDPDERARAAVGYITLPAARTYCAWLNAQTQTAERPRRYRLPTEDEWEHACRAGGSGRFAYGDDAEFVRFFANCNGSAPRWHLAGQHMPNWYGLFDLHGGLWEWTESQQAGLGQTAFVYRGGAFYSPAVRCRCAQRNYGSPDIADSYRGCVWCWSFSNDARSSMDHHRAGAVAGELRHGGSRPADRDQLCPDQPAPHALRGLADSRPRCHRCVGLLFHRAIAAGCHARHRFLDTVNDACPDALDLQILLYDRVNGDLPIGLDPDETVTDAPVVAGALRNVPACSVQPLETFTVVNWDTDDDTGRVKLAQATPIEQVLRATDFLGNADAVWEILNTDSTLAAEAPPAAAPGQPIRGQVVAPDGAPWEGVGVLVRTRWRSNLDLANPAADSGFGDPIDFTFTDADGNFSFTRPAGAYRVEVFADDLIFSPASADVEVPQTALVFIAEAIP
jgi:hypothetical protein